MLFLNIRYPSEIAVTPSHYNPSLCSSAPTGWETDSVCVCSLLNATLWSLLLLSFHVWWRLLMVLHQEEKCASSGSGVDNRWVAAAAAEAAAAERSVYDNKTSAQRSGWFPVTIMDLIRYHHHFEILACTILISSLVVIGGKWLLFLPLFTRNTCLMWCCSL